jgi:hypothetical protein
VEEALDVRQEPTLRADGGGRRHVFDWEVAPPQAEGERGGQGLWAFSLLFILASGERLERRKRERDQKLLFHVIQVRVEQGEKGDFGDGKLEKGCDSGNPVGVCLLAHLLTEYVAVF